MQLADGLFEVPLLRQDEVLERWRVTHRCVGTGDAHHMEANVASLNRPPLPAADRQRLIDLFGHLQSLPIGFFDTHTAGEVMSRLTNDIDAINQAVSHDIL